MLDCTNCGGMCEIHYHCPKCDPKPLTTEQAREVEAIFRTFRVGETDQDITDQINQALVDQGYHVIKIE